MEKPSKIAENTWQIAKKGKMKVPGIIYASDLLMDHISKEGKTLEQIRNVASLPGIIEKALAMPDAHQGYGFPIGGVAAFDLDTGIISPGGVGYDINCGVRLLSLNLSESEFLEKRNKIISDLAKAVPAGVGEQSKFLLTVKEIDEVLNLGVGWCLKKGYANKEDVEKIEDSGCLPADASKVSQKAKSRGLKQLGSLGSGNHFLEIQKVESIYDAEVSKKLGLKLGNITIMIHSGSRGVGHQTASDYIQKMDKEYGHEHLQDRELVHAPINSKLGQDYFKAMNASANFAFANRQVITYQIRQVFEKYFPKVKVNLIYDIAHNIAKIEKHKIENKNCEVCIHRKGATRSFGPGRNEIPEQYRSIGQPIFIPGSMGTFSYVLLGNKKAEKLSFGSTAHGAGRLLSRSYAIKNLDLSKIQKSLENQNIKVHSESTNGLLEEAPEAYKDINEVAKVSDELGLGSLVARLKPLAVIKG